MKLEELNEYDEFKYFPHRPRPRRINYARIIKVIGIGGVAVLFCVALYYSGSHASYARIESLEQELDVIKSMLREQTNRARRDLEEVKPMIHKLVKRNNKDQVQIIATGLGGVSYVRWGRRNCPNNDQTKLVYEGIAAGSHHDHHGGGSNILCLDRNVTYRAGNYVNGNQGSSYIYGLEYRDNVWADQLFDLSLIEGGDFRFHNIPCTVCMASGRVNQLMIPGRDTCPQSWTKEYTGYILSSAYAHAHSSDYLCVDDTPQVVPGSDGDQSGGLLYVVETQCPSLQCEPFVLGRELKCVVCTI